MSADGGRQGGRSMVLRVSALSAAIAVLATLISLPSITAPDRKLPLHIHWALMLAFFAAALLAPLRLEVQKNSLFLSLMSAPLTVALLSQPRVTLVVLALVSNIVIRSLDRKIKPIKLIFNIPLMFFEVSVTMAIFDRAVPNPVPDHPRTWLTLLAAIAFTSVLSTGAVNLVIVLTGDRLTASDSLRHIITAVANESIVVVLTFTTIMLGRVYEANAVLMAPLVLGAIIPLRRLAMLRRKYDNLLLLQQFTTSLGATVDLVATLDSALTESSRVLRADAAEIVLLQGERVVRRRLTPTQRVLAVDGDPLWKEVMGGHRVLLSQGADGFTNQLGRTGTKDLMAVPLVRGAADVVGMLVVADRMGDVSSFDDDDLAIFATMANQVTTTLDNFDLLDRLHSEKGQREHEALHDALTGLPNRMALYNALDEMLLDRRADLLVSAMVLDINRFKEINDTLGHTSGDAVLIETGRRLRAIAPDERWVFRLGGDEFAVLCPDVTDVIAAQRKAEEIASVFVEPFAVEGMSLRLDCSLGFALAPFHGRDSLGVLRFADVAVQAAKSQRGTAIRCYEPSQDQSSPRTLALVTELRKSLDADGLDVAFQPKALMATGVVTGVEALTRWEHPTYGRIRPDEFIHMAEQAGLIGQLTRLVLRRSIAAHVKWRERGHLLTVAVNIDADTLADPEFAAELERQLRENDVDPSMVTLEITERDLVQEYEHVTEVIKGFRSQGMKLSIDDFGTGYSSLSYLVRLPVDEVKIDRSFVIDVARSPRHATIVRGITEMASSLGLRTVVEGVEDEETWATLRALGCEQAQGYYLSRPISDDALLDWLERRPKPIGIIDLPA